MIERIYDLLASPLECSLESHAEPGYQYHHHHHHPPLHRSAQGPRATKGWRWGWQRRWRKGELF